MKKKDKQNSKTANQPVIAHGPVAKREDRLSAFLRWSLISHVVLLLAAGLFATAAVLKPDRVVVVEKETGRVVGEYRTTAYRTNNELMAGNQKFAENFLSLNSRTIYDDCAVALNMMAPSLRDRRTDYLKRTNLLKNIEKAETRSRLDIKNKKILLVEGHYAKIEISGDIIVDQQRDIYVTDRSKKMDKEDVKLKRNTIAFRLVTDLKMVPVTEMNTTGVEVADYYEYN